MSRGGIVASIVLAVYDASIFCISLSLTLSGSLVLSFFPVLVDVGLLNVVVSRWLLLSSRCFHPHSAYNVDHHYYTVFLLVVLFRRLFVLRYSSQLSCMLHLLAMKE